METKSEKRERIKKNQTKMVVSGMYLRKVLLPLMNSRGLGKR